MIGAVAVRIVGAAEVRAGEGGHLALHAEFDGGVVEGGQGLADLREQRTLGGQFHGVGVEAAETGEENLALEAEGGGGGNQPARSSTADCPGWWWGTWSRGPWCRSEYARQAASCCPSRRSWWTLEKAAWKRLDSGSG